MWWRRRGPSEDEFRQEIDAHIALETDRLIGQGLSPADAQREARLIFGNPTSTCEAYRASRRFGWFDHLRREVHGSLRALRHARGFVGVSVLTVIASVGAAVTVFTFMNALWLRPPPVADPENVVVVLRRSQLFDPSRVSVRGLDNYRQFGVFTEVAGQVLTRGPESGDLAPRLVIRDIGRQLETLAVTPEYFRVLGLTVIGRDFTREDAHPQRPIVAIISEPLWKASFGADPGVIGATLAASPVPIQVIGVAPPGFRGALRGENVDVWVPHATLPRLAVGVADLGAVDRLTMIALARIPSNVSIDTARRTFRQAYGAQGRNPGDLDLVPLGHLFGAVDLPLVVMHHDGIISMVAAVSGLLLAAGVTTLLALLLVHYERRRVELAIRLALGASRQHLVCQLSLELGAIALMAALGALASAAIVLRGLPRFTLPGGVDLGRLDLTFDWRVVAVGVAASLALAALAGSVPIARFTRAAIATSLVSAAVGSRPTSVRFRQVVLGIHVALTVLLLLTAGLFSQSLINAVTYGPGFDDAHTLFVSLKTRPSWAWTTPRAAETEADARARRDAASTTTLLERLGGIPGVESVALGEAPIGPRAWLGLQAPYLIETDTGSYDVRAAPHSVSPEYFDALGLPMLEGRSGAPGELVISASLARIGWPNESPLGRTLRWGPVSGTVVGVVDTAYASIRMGRAPVFFRLDLSESLPFRLASYPLAIVLRSRDPDALRGPVRRTVTQIFPDSTSIEMVSGRALVEADLGRERLGAWFLSGVGGAGWLLGVGSVFGLVAYVAHSRRREFGVRLALGASARRLVWLAMTTAMKPVGIGAAAGIVAAILLSTTIQSFLLGIPAVHAPTYAGVLMLYGVSAAIAGLLAAWRLRRLAPAIALRME